MVAKINILSSCTNVVAKITIRGAKINIRVFKIHIRVFKIQEQLTLKFGKKVRTASLNLIFNGSYKKKYTICRKKLRQVFLTLFNSVYFCHFWHGSNEN